jgi:DNA polymerase-1
MVTSALFGTCNTLLNVIKEFKPTHVVGALDAKEKTFRHKMYDAYKANRPECPPELAAQLEKQELLLEALGCAWVKHPGFEADDIVAAYTKLSQSLNGETIIFSGDKDFMQLLDDKTSMLLSHRGGESEILKHDKVFDKVGVRPDQVADYLALMGDSADNIPGAPGVGPKTAAQLLAEFGDLKTALDSTHLIKKKGLASKLVDHREQVLLSRELVELNTDLPDLRGMDDLIFKGVDRKKALPFLREMEFPKIIARLGAEFSAASTSVPSSTALEGDPSMKEGGNEGLGSQGGQVASFELDFKFELLQSVAELVAQMKKQAVEDGAEGANEKISAHLVIQDHEAMAVAMGTQEQYYVVDLREGDVAFEDMSYLMSLKVITQDSKAWTKWGMSHGVEAKLNSEWRVQDILLMETVLHQSGRDVSLETLAAKELGLGFPELGKSGNRKRTWKDLSGEELAQHMAHRCSAMVPLFDILEPAMKSKGVWAIYESLELPLVRVIAMMESEGVRLDSELLKGFSKESDAELENLTSSIHEMAGEEFNIKSTQQLGKILFEKLKLQDELKLKKLKKTKTGYSTDSSVLESLGEHPMGKALLRYRFLTKLKSTYMDALPKQVRAHTGKLHTTYYQNGTSTGRLSSADPNLQNIPMRVPEGARIREAFVASDDSKVLLAADYSQIELRVLAYFCRDEVMLEAYQQGLDIHAATAAKVFGISQDWVTPQQRSSAKAVNFGLLYGMGPKLLSQQTGLSFSEARGFIKSYFENFPKVQGFMTEQVDKARAAGYVTTLSGRRRDLPDLQSSNGMLRSAAENMALNTPIQGSAADIIKWSMLRLQKKIEAENLPMKLLLQVHDELVLEVDRDALESMKALIKEEMESKLDLPKDFDVPLTVEVGQGDNWLQAH